MTAFVLGAGLGAFAAAQIQPADQHLLGSASWFAALRGVVALARHRVRGAWLVAVDVVSDPGLVVFGGALGVRTLRDI